MSRTALVPTAISRSRALPLVRAGWIKWLVAAAALLTFSPICRHGFVAWDDDYTIEHNALIQHPSVHNVLHYWTHSFMDLYVPVTYTIWSGIAALSRLITGAGPDVPVGAGLFHTVSVLLHAANALLVFWLLRRLLKRPWPAAAGALLFALHPIQVEAVAWTSGMKDILCGTFVLIALTQYVLAVAPSEAGERHRGSALRRVHYALGILAMLLGMLSKPTAMVTPALALVIDRLLLNRSWRKALIAAAPWFLAAAPCLVWTKMCQPAGFLQIVPVWQRPLIAADALAFYLYKLLFPVHLAFDYGRAPWVALGAGWAYWTWIVPVGIGISLFIFRRRSVPLIAAALLMVIAVAPVLGFAVFDFEMISTVADHYMYVAMLGPALALAWALGHLKLDAHARAGWPAAAVVIALGLLAARAADQQRYWQDSDAFFLHDLQINPQSWSSNYKLAFLLHNQATDLLAVIDTRAGHEEDRAESRETARLLLIQALGYYDAAIQSNPRSLASRHGRALVLMHFGHYREAADGFAYVLSHRYAVPPAARAQFDVDIDALGQCQYNLRRYAQAVRSFQAALKTDPPVPGAAEHLAFARAALASTHRR